MSGLSHLDRFSALEDPRQVWKVGYLLPEILQVMLCTTMAGAEKCVGQAALDQIQAIAD